MPGGHNVNLKLRRVPLYLGKGGIWVDGQPTSQDVETTLSLWSGSVIRPT